MRALVLAANIHHFNQFQRDLGLSPHGLMYSHGDIHAIMGLDRRTSVVILEGFKHNRNYKVGFMEYLQARFHNFGFITDEEYIQFLRVVQ